MALGRLLAVVLLVVAILGVAEAGIVGSPSDVYVRNDGETTRTVTVEVTDPGLFDLGVLGGTAAEDADGTVSTIGYGGCRAVMVYVERMSTRYACFDQGPCRSDNPFVERGWC